MFLCTNRKMGSPSVTSRLSCLIIRFCDHLSKCQVGTVVSETTGIDEKIGGAASALSHPIDALTDTDCPSYCFFDSDTNQVSVSYLTIDLFACIYICLCMGGIAVIRPSGSSKFIGLWGPHQR